MLQRDASLISTKLNASGSCATRGPCIRLSGAGADVSECVPSACVMARPSLDACRGGRGAHIHAQTWLILAAWPGEHGRRPDNGAPVEDRRAAEARSVAAVSTEIVTMIEEPIVEAAEPTAEPGRLLQRRANGSRRHCRALDDAVDRNVGRLQRNRGIRCRGGLGAGHAEGEGRPEAETENLEPIGEAAP